jgi:2-oxoglutarate dehydrogenase E1 component
LDTDFKSDLQARLDNVKQNGLAYKARPHEDAWKLMIKAESKDFVKSIDTNIDENTFQKIAKAIHEVPKDFKVLTKMEKQLKDWRARMIDKRELDWQGAELLAYGSLLNQGNPIRFSGEDVKRGTFTHRHACIFDEAMDTEYCRLSNIDPKQGKMHIHNSHLSEYGVLGYEYGYSLASPDNFVIWEAQFGDFINGAQIILDQFLLSSETKWGVGSGMMLLLPHGYEGQGPEHSSARMERFLQGCAEFNIQVANITTPANFFHAIRRQMQRNFRIPLVVMSPKSLLRHAACVSPVEDVLKGGFQEMIADAVKDPKKIKKVLCCSGKIYYDLVKNNTKPEEIAIVRVEQLYPLPIEQLEKVFALYEKAEFCWVQEEPSNMGSWMYLLHQSVEIWNTVKWKFIGRKSAASPATGIKKQHIKEDEEILKACFG